MQSCTFLLVDHVDRQQVDKAHLTAPPLNSCCSWVPTPSIPRNARRGGAFIISLYRSIDDNALTLPEETEIPHPILCRPPSL
jgi:hypothetical protein